MKTIKIMAALLLLCVVVSCSKDDDDSGSASTSAGVIDKKTGLRVTSVGNYRIYYDDKGRVDYIRDNYEKWTFSYNPNIITYYERYNDDDGGKYNVGYNGLGYLASLNYSDSNQDGNDKWSESANVTFSYDGNGHLTKISVSGKYSGTEDGERFNETWTDSYSFSWGNSRLQKVVYTEKYVEDGETETEKETWIFSYDNENYENAYQQWVPSIVGYFEGQEQVWAWVGLLGVGPNMLPSSAENTEEEYYDGKSYNHNNSYTFRYGFNSDGSISYTTINGTRYNFSYDYAENDSRKNAPTPGVQEREFVKSLRHVFRRHKDI